MPPELSLPPEIERIAFSPDQLAAAVESIAQRVAADYAGRELVLVGVLKGALFFVADLARAIAARPNAPAVTLDFIAVSSYGNARRSSGEVRLVQDTAQGLEGKEVLIVEDIVDNGHTLAYLRALFANRSPASLRAAVLLEKPYRRVVPVAVEYAGLTCPDAFVVGYGLDYQERYRTLPYLATLRPEAFPS